MTEESQKKKFHKIPKLLPFACHVAMIMIRSFCYCCWLLLLFNWQIKQIAYIESICRLAHPSSTEHACEKFTRLWFHVGVATPVASWVCVRACVYCCCFRCHCCCCIAVSYLSYFYSNSVSRSVVRSFAHTCTLSHCLSLFHYLP